MVTVLGLVRNAHVKVNTKTMTWRWWYEVTRLRVMGLSQRASAFHLPEGRPAWGDRAEGGGGG
jgi:hypothetical protein